MTRDNPDFNELIEDHEPSALISELTFFKNINSTFIESFLTSKNTPFMNNLTFETGLSNHHKFIGPMLRYLHLPQENLKKYFTAVTETVIMKSLKKN